MEEVTPPTERKYLNDAIDGILDLEKENTGELVSNSTVPSVLPPVAVKGTILTDDIKKNDEKNSVTLIPQSGRAGSDYIKERSQDIRDDYNHSRRTLQELLEDGKDALTYLIGVAKATDKYEYFDSISKMMKELAVITEKMMDTQVVRTELDKEVDGENNQPNTINNNLFIGSTKELLDMINGKKIDNK